MENPYTAPIASGNVPALTLASGAGTITLGMIEALRLTRPWVLFMAILGFIGSGLALLFGLLMIGMGAMPGFPEQSGFATPWLGLLYWIFIPLYLVPSLKLYRYAGAIQRLAAGGGAPAMEDALNQQKGFWKLVGIFAILSIVLYVLAIAGVMVVTLTNRF